MNIEEQLKRYRENQNIIPDEQHIKETVRKSIESYCSVEQEKQLTYWEFLWTELHLIRKRWWLLQMLLLWTAATFLPDLLDNRYVIRMLGMIGVLFIVLMIPEFWKNKSCDCMQIEATCLYSLRQIYAARIFLFGIVDLFMISLFCITLRGSVNLALSEIVIQFLFPAVVTACICFGTLCSNSRVNEGTSIILCLLWSGIWWFIINNETIYVLITLPVWYALFGTAVVFLIGAIYKTIFDCNKFWEVDLSGTTIS